MCERFCPDVCIVTMCMPGACRGRRGSHSPWNWCYREWPLAYVLENWAWVFWRPARALNHRGNFLAPERFFFFKAVYSRFLSIIDWNQIRNLQAGLVPPPLQPTRSPCIRTHGGNCLQAGSSSANTQSIFRSICPQNWAILHQWTTLALTKLGHLTSVNYYGSSPQASLV